MRSTTAFSLRRILDSIVQSDINVFCFCSEPVNTSFNPEACCCANALPQHSVLDLATHHHWSVFGLHLTAFFWVGFQTSSDQIARHHEIEPELSLLVAGKLD